MYTIEFEEFIDDELNKNIEIFGTKNQICRFFWCNQEIQEDTQNMHFVYGIADIIFGFHVWKLKITRLDFRVKWSVYIGIQNNTFEKQLTYGQIFKYDDNILENIIKEPSIINMYLDMKNAMLRIVVNNNTIKYNIQTGNNISYKMFIGLLGNRTTVLLKKYQNHY